MICNYNGGGEDFILKRVKKFLILILSMFPLFEVGASTF